MLAREFVLDIGTPPYPPMISTTLYDYGAEYWADILRDGVYLSPGNYGTINNVYVTYKRPDGVIRTINCGRNVSGQTLQVSFKVPEHMAGKAGLVECMISIEYTASGELGRVTTNKFYFKVEPEV